MQRLGVIGGTFDPVHAGHLLLALSVLEVVGLDRVVFVPAADPPHKERRPDMASAEDRFAMVRLATERLPCFEVSRVEMERPGKSYTVDTLRHLHRLHPHTQLYLIIGADNVAQLPTWHDPEAILELCTVVAGSRATPGPHGVDPALAERVMIVPTRQIDVSSTEIRERLAAGRPVSYLVPERVDAYIRSRRLYGAGP
ncbi:MAG: nicotinate-nucleotide adenylyltransferase [Candidatus Latescibacterota bacterium]